MEKNLHIESIETLKQNLEQIINDIPANYILGVAAASWLLSRGLKSAKKENAAAFVETLAAPIFTVGLYKKLEELDIDLDF